ncbi:MAG TPA: ATP-binding protein [Candidatus Phocaeicola merdavium]|nr:ATP-binding protein [Candidatus Phocaeicola merdavium]
MTHSDYIHRLISEGEHVHQDFKFEISDARKIAKSISAFANTEGGRLLVGVKDNGKIAGVRSEEEIYMIEAAAQRYCQPPVDIHTYIYKVEGKDILEVVIDESPQKPVYALDAEERKWAYVRIKDENILANPIHLNIWRHNRTEEKIVVAYTPREQQVLTLLGQHESLTLNQCQRLARMNRKQITSLLADFIRFGLVEQVFREHAFYFRLKEHID